MVYRSSCGRHFEIHDRDSKCGDSFVAVFASEHIKVIRTPFRAPNANAYAERWVCSVCEECLDRLIILNPAHLKYVLHEYEYFFNTARPHQVIGQKIPDPAPEDSITGIVNMHATIPQVIP